MFLSASCLACQWPANLRGCLHCEMVACGIYESVLQLPVKSTPAPNLKYHHQISSTIYFFVLMLLQLDLYCKMSQQH